MTTGFYNYTLTINNNTFIRNQNSINVDGWYYPENTIIMRFNRFQQIPCGGAGVNIGGIDGGVFKFENNTVSDGCTYFMNVAAGSSGNVTVNYNTFSNNTYNGYGNYFIQFDAPSTQTLVASYNTFMNNAMNGSMIRLSRGVNAQFKYNVWINQSSDLIYDIANSFVGFSPTQTIDLTYNYWGSTSELYIMSQIQDYRDSCNLALAQYWPPLFSASYSDVAPSNATRQLPIDPFTCSAVGSILSDPYYQLNSSVCANFTIQGCFTILANSTFAISAGVKIGVSQSSKILVYGQLEVRGNATNRVLITSTSPTKAWGQWYGIYFSASAVGASYDAQLNYLSGSILEYADIECGGQGATSMIDVAATTLGRTPYFNNLNVSLSSGSGINVNVRDTNVPHPNTIFNRVNVQNIYYYGIFYYPGWNSTFHFYNCTFSAIQYHAFYGAANSNPSCFEPNWVKINAIDINVNNPSGNGVFLDGSRMTTVYLRNVNAFTSSDSIGMYRANVEARQISVRSRTSIG